MSRVGGRRTLGWAVFGIASIAALAALAWVSVSVISLERREALARAEAAHQQTVRLALWRMDSWMTPRLAAEASRPYFHYLAFYPPRRAYDQYLSKIAEGEVLTPSPLLGFSDDVLRLHLQVDNQHRVTSPQAPEANQRDLVEGAMMLSPERVQANVALLDHVRRELEGVPLVARVAQVEACQTAVIGNEANPIEWLPRAGEGLSWQFTSRLADADTSTTVVESSAMLDGALAAERDRAIATDDRAVDPKVATKGDARSEPPFKSATFDKTDLPRASAKDAKPDEASKLDGAFVQRVDPKDVAAKVEATASPPNRRAQAPDNDYARRLATSNVAQSGQQKTQRAGAIEARVDIGPFVPLWVAHGDGAPSLYYFRRVETSDATMVQGFLVDWPKLCDSLRAEVADLLPNARLEPVSTSADDPAPDADDTRLASIPAQLVAGAPAADPPGSASPATGAPALALALTPARSILAVAWLALVAAIAAAGLSLRAVQLDATRRARFAGTVTHELRTPLTTFQLYTDLLADDMIPPERRGEYLATLRSESHRLGHLVENVLSYARIEQGRHVPTPSDVTTTELLARVEPALRRRAEEAGMRLVLQDATRCGGGDGAPGDDHAGKRWHIDVDSTERILFNLVDNATKYAADDSPDLVIRAEMVDDRLHLLVVDRGPGLPRDSERRLFKPFERGADDRTHGRRGIGLGLALSRELARALGGDLTHEATPGGGATFRVAL